MAERLYKDNYRTIYCGDSRQMIELPDECIQMVCTSPPYWGFKEPRFGLQSEVKEQGNRCV